MLARHLSLTLLLATAPLFLAGQPKPKPKLTQAADSPFTAADQALNDVYQELMRDYSRNPEFLKNLRAAQRLWVPFRDAQLAMKFPERKAGFYGSALAMCKAQYLADLTNARTAQLKEWLKPEIEGDVCAGTLAEGDVE